MGEISEIEELKALNYSEGIVGVITTVARTSKLLTDDSVFP